MVRSVLVTIDYEDRRCRPDDFPTVSDGAGRAVRGIALGIALGALVLGACSLGMLASSTCATSGETMDALQECVK